MRLAVTGSSGLIGSALVEAAVARGDEVLRLVRRDPTAPDEVAWDPERGTVDVDALAGVDAIAHLAGETIGARWTTARRARVLGSRVDGTTAIAEAVAALEPRPALVCASAIGFYGDRGDEILTDESLRGTGFLADVVEAWESAADPARDAGARVAHMRTAIVVSREGGAVARLLTPFRLGLGGRVGSGRQWWSWVSLPDVVAAYLWVLDRQLAGPLVVSAPNPVTNRQFVDALGRALHRPTAIPLPALAVRVGLGRMGQEMLLQGQRVLPARLLEDGFAFAQPTLDEALAATLRG